MRTMSELYVDRDGNRHDKYMVNQFYQALRERQVERARLLRLWALGLAVSALSVVALVVL